MKQVSAYLNDTPTFAYDLIVRVNSKTYIDRMIAFERAFLTLGEKYGFFVAVPLKEGIYLSLEPLLDKYEKERRMSLEQRKTEALTLLNFEESKYLRNRVAYVGLDVRGAEFDDGEAIAPIDLTDEQELRAAAALMEIVPFAGPLYEDLMDEFYWEENLRIRLKSSANLWLETITSGGGDDPAHTVDNHAVANRLAPMFNSFLRELRALVEGEHGSVTLNDTFSEQVTEEGILLEGELRFA